MTGPLFCAFVFCVPGRPIRVIRMPYEFASDRPYADPEKAARKLVEIANAVEAVQDGRIQIEKINAPFLFREGGTAAKYGAGLRLAIERGWLELHEVGRLSGSRRQALICSLKQGSVG